MTRKTRKKKKTFGPCIWPLACLLPSFVSFVSFVVNLFWDSHEAAGSRVALRCAAFARSCAIPAQAPAEARFRWPFGAGTDESGIARGNGTPRAKPPFRSWGVALTVDGAGGMKWGDL